jgi:chymotrypsin-like protease
MTKYGGSHANVLQQAKLPLVSHEECSAVNGVLREVDKLTMLCAGYGGNSSISGCHGDSGGPFVCQEGGRWFLRGAVSWGDHKCSGKMYSVFTRISSLIDWIDYRMYKNPLEKRRLLLSLIRIQRII